MWFKRINYTSSSNRCPVCKEEVKEILGVYLHPENSCEFANDGIFISKEEESITIYIRDQFLQNKLKEKVAQPK